MGGLTGFVDQKTAARFERVRAAVMAEPRRFARQGSVVASWRVYAGRRLGPYLRLAYREGRRQRSIYLGRCAELVRRVRITDPDAIREDREARLQLEDLDDPDVGVAAAGWLLGWLDRRSEEHG